jgi:phosphoribosylanthranilate isomerase
MTVEVKICGLRDLLAIEAAVTAGARFVGLNFYPPSPRSVSVELARELARAIPAEILKVGVVVDADDALIDAVAATVGVDMLQLHGAETPARASAVAARSGKPVIKAIAVADAGDIAAAHAYLGTVQWLLFDAKPPSLANAMPGGNALAFDWTLLAQARWPVPWMLAGGLNPENVGDALRLSGARAVDVSSGVESRPGIKDPDRIRAFLAAAMRP